MAIELCGHESKQVASMACARHGIQPDFGDENESEYLGETDVRAAMSVLMKDEGRGGRLRVIGICFFALM